MGIENLPADMIYRIQNQVVCRKRLYYDEWKAALVLQWICRSWRQVTMPTLCSWAIIECVECDNLQTFPYSPSSFDEDSMEGAQWMSNLSFIKLLGSGSTLRTLNLTQKVEISPIVFLQQAVYFLRSENITFHNVHMLEVKIAAHILNDEEDDDDYEDEETDGESEDESVDSEHNGSRSITNHSITTRRRADNTDIIENAVGILVSKLPGIKQLELLVFPACMNNPILQSFYAKLIGKYVHQLKLLKCQVYLDCASSNFTSQLQNLQIHLPATEARSIPTIDTAEIRSLDINNVPSKLPWSKFENRHTPGNIYFDRLEELHFSYERKPYTHETQPQLDTKAIFANIPKVHFPKLHTLSMRLCPHDYLALFKNWRPEVANSITIFGSVCHVQHGPLSRLKSINFLRIDIESAPLKDQDTFYEITNRLYSKVNITREAHLGIYHPAFEIDSRRIFWPNLTHLVYDKEADLFDVLDIIPLLPKLVDLQVFNLTFERAPEAIGNYLAPEWHTLVSQPLQTSLSSFSHYTYFRDRTTTFAASVNLYLMARIPTLLKYEAYARFKDEIEEGRVHLSTRYAHLQTVNISCLQW